MSARHVYLDSSAFIKLVVEEAETAALRRYLEPNPSLVAAALLRTEVLRACMRISHTFVATARQMLADVAFIEVDRPVLQRAGELGPPEMRSLDAIHIAAALSMGEDLDQLITYDHRMIDAARQWGLTVVTPT